MHTYTAFGRHVVCPACMCCCQEYQLHVCFVAGMRCLLMDMRRLLSRITLCAAAAGVAAAAARIKTAAVSLLGLATVLSRAS